jgi:dihydrofolate reductase
LRKGTATVKLTTMTQVSVDGVMQGNGGSSEEDRRSGFERGGWAMGKADNETRTFISQTYQGADAFLFGRRTYGIFAAGWGAMDRGSHPIADALNTKPKYLASTTITDPQWANTTVLCGDLAAAVGEPDQAYPGSPTVRAGAARRTDDRARRGPGDDRASQLAWAFERLAREPR